MTMNARLSVDNRGIDKVMAQNCTLQGLSDSCLSVCLSVSVCACVCSFQVFVRNFDAILGN